MKTVFRGLMLAAVLGLGVVVGASAQVSVVDGSASVNNKVIDFSQFASDWQFGAGPTQVGGLVGEDVMFNASTSSSVLGGGSGAWYGVGDNGVWQSKSAAGLNELTGWMAFTFNSGPVSFVGAFLNYVPGYGNPFIEALATDGSVLASFALNISTPGQTNGGEFWGFESTAANIGGFRVNNAYIVMDDLTFNRDPSNTVTPEPVSMALLGTGLAGVAGARRRRSERARDA